MSKYTLPDDKASEILEPLIGGIDGFKYLPLEGKYRNTPSRKQVYFGRGSWFGQFSGINKWVDNEDNGQNASGLPQHTPGLAYMSRETLKHWFKVTFPNDKSFIVRHIDIGPSNWTGKMIDINAPLAEMAGYSPRNFPTGGIIRFQYIGKEEPIGATKVYRRPT